MRKVDTGSVAFLLNQRITFESKRRGDWLTNSRPGFWCGRAVLCSLAVDLLLADPQGVSGQGRGSVNRLHPDPCNNRGDGVPHPG